MKTIKRIFTVGIFLIIIGVILSYKNKIYITVDNYLHPYKYVSLDGTNDYYRDYDFLYVQNTIDFIPNNKNELLNIYYTVLNSGKSSFTFYCTNDYPSCISDIQDIANDQDILNDINNYVHPFNGFSHIETEYDSLGRVTINILHNYSQDDIDIIEKKVDELSKKLIQKDKTEEENIKIIHDYIINNSRYDSIRETTGESEYSSSTAYGPLFEGYGLCSGYTDLMQLFLEKLNIKNYRISTEKHVWNAVYVNGRWRHLDVTWDDPVSSDGSDILEYKYFLIDTPTILELDKDKKHDFRVEFYQEFKEA